MFTRRIIIAFASLGLLSGVAHAQQVQVPIADGVTQVSPDGECPDGTVRRTQVVGQQVAQQGFGRTIHYCVRSDRLPDSSQQQLPELAEERAWPTLLPISQFGTPGTNSDIVLQTLTDDELLLLRDRVSEISFANYRLSGCHDRAHAAYLVLPEELRAKAGKLWVVAPSLYTRGVRGNITYQADESVSWGYHVALAFLTDDGVMLFDPTLSPGRLLTESEWLGSFDYPRLSFRMMSDANVYLFFNEHNDIAAMNRDYGYIQNVQIWTGAGFDYTGPSREQDWIPNALARDSVGALVEDGRVCETLQQYKGDPDGLLSALQGGTLPSSCASEASLFDSTREEWSARLN